MHRGLEFRGSNRFNPKQRRTLRRLRVLRAQGQTSVNLEPARLKALRWEAPEVLSLANIGSSLTSSMTTAISWTHRKWSTQRTGPAAGLSRAAAGRRHPRNLAAPGVVCRILLELNLGIPGAFHSRTGHYCDANNVRPVRRQSLARGATLRFGRPEIGPVAPFYFTMSCSLMTDRPSVHGDPLRRKHSHAPVRAVRKCLYVEIGGKVVGRAHHRRWG